jgi:hypothetical protein
MEEINKWIPSITTKHTRQYKSTLELLEDAEKHKKQTKNNTKKIMEQYNEVQEKTTKAMEQYQQLQNRLETLNSKINDDYNRYKYQRDKEYAKIVENEKAKMQEYMETTTVKSMALYKERFRSHLNRLIPVFTARHLKSLDKDFESKQSKMISDLDSVSEDLRATMNQDLFQEPWNQFKENQMTQKNFKQQSQR